MGRSKVIAMALACLCAAAAVGRAAVLDEARAACEAAQAKVAESVRSVEIAKEALATAKADKAVAPERVKELKGQLKAAEAALDENRAAVKKAVKTFEKAQRDDAAAKKAAEREEALKKARAEREAAEKEKVAKMEKRAAEIADKEKKAEDARKAREDARKVLDEKRAAYAADEIRRAEATENLALALKAEEVKENLGSREADIKAAGEERQKATERLAAAKAEVERAGKALDATRTQKDEAMAKKAREDFEKARKELKAAEGEARAKERDFENLNASIARMQAEMPAKAKSVKEAQELERFASEVSRKSRKEMLEAEATLLSLVPRRQNYDTKALSVETANAILARAVPQYSFAGDICWLAGTSIDGMPLYEHFARGGDIQENIRDATAAAVRAGFFFAGFADAGEKDGKRQILVDKGRIGAINVKFYEDKGQEREIAPSNTNYSIAQIQRKMGNGQKSRGASEGEVFNFNDINGRFSELNGHPDIAKANIAFSPADGRFDYIREDGSAGDKGRAVTMDVNVTEEKIPFHFVLGVDNFGSVDGDDSNAYSKDSWMAHGTVQHLNMFGAGHILTVNGSAAVNGELYGVSAGYMVPRLDNGEWWDWNWTLHGGFTDVDEEEVIKAPAVDVKGLGYFGGLQMSKRLLDTGRSTLDLSLGATYRYVESEISIKNSDGKRTTYKYGKYGQDGKIDDEGYEILPLSAALMYSESTMDSLGGRNFATIEGIYGLGLSDLENFKGFRYQIEDENYWLARVQLARIQLLGDFNYADAEGLPSLFFKADGQYAPDPIVSAEQFAIGGHNSVRGYKERQFLGDSGATGTIELRSPIYTGIFNGTVVRGTVPYDRWQFLVFADVGHYSLIDGRGTGEDDSETIYSVGAGFRLALGNHWQVRCDVGFPLKDGEKDEKTNDETFETDTCRLHLGVQAQW